MKKLQKSPSKGWMHGAESASKRSWTSKRPRIRAHLEALRAQLRSKKRGE